MTARPPIPADLRRRILVEAGHRCAIPSCRHTDVEIHHIVPWETCKKHEYSNLIALCPNCHTRAHKHGEIDRKSLNLYKANLRFTHDRFSQLEVDILFDLSQKPEDKVAWGSLNKLLLKRIIDWEYIEYSETDQWFSIDGTKTNPDYIQISPKGIDYIRSLGEIELEMGSN